MIKLFKAIPYANGVCRVPSPTVTTCRYGVRGENRGAKTYQEREIMKTIKLSKIKNEFFRMGDDRLWFKSGYDKNERAWRVCLVKDPLRYKLVESKTEVQL